ncbi:LysR family transcriptional regulator [Carnimonas nigrificans]|uniref:LysR family transcriptional regulator n=1 Tax=Carnimonas nigrificans TaxID=64323 RepID=UPI000471E0BD|nr:LysR family transcriptional regulator [Carnimonas nigrificans]
MDHRQLQFLVALAREQHFGRAARRCHVTQPTLSARIKQLENELGMSLIERDRRFGRFTEEGERVLYHAQRVLQEFQALRNGSGSQRHHQQRFRVGTVPAAAADIVQWPGLRTHTLSFSLKEYSMPALLQALADNEIDLAVGYLDAALVMSEEFVTLPLFNERLMLFASPRYFQLPTTLGWPDLERFPHGILSGDMRHRRSVDTLFKRHDLTIDVRFEADSAVMLGTMVAHGHGVAILPQALQQQLAPLGLQALGLPDNDIESSRIGMIWRRDEPLSIAPAYLLGQEEASLPPSENSTTAA